MIEHSADRAIRAASGTQTPFFIIDFDVVDLEVRDLRQAWTSLFPSVEIAYPYKANALRALTSHLAILGFSAEVASGVELHQALEDGFGGEKILFGGPVKKDVEICAALVAGARLVVDSSAELGRAADLASSLGATGQVLLRLSTPRSGDWSRFGILPDEFEACVARIDSGPLRLDGIAFHLGSNLRDPATYAAAVQMFAPLLLYQLARRPGSRATLDVGGGFAARGGSSHEPGPAAFADSVRAALEQARVPIERVDLVLEPGRALVETAGWLVSSVSSLKRRGDLSLVFLDAGGNLLAEPRARHPVKVVSAADDCAARTHQIYGPLCMEGDVLWRDLIAGEALALGDLFVIGNVGAYDIATASTWMRGVVPVLGVRAGRTFVLRPAGPPDRGAKIPGTSP